MSLCDAEIEIEAPAPARQQLEMVVDLDERGSFRAHVEDASGKAIFSFSNEDESGWPEGNLWLVEFGYMRHCRDGTGLLSYLQEMGIANAGDSLKVSG